MSAAAAWRVRHEGSPQSIDNLTLHDVALGLEEGRWETTDEVRGPTDANWIAIENHPQLEEIAAELEPPPPRDHDEEGHVDLNALIDVCLVLLVFFILTTSYVALTKQLDAPDTTPDGDKQIKKIAKDDADKLTIRVDVKMEGGNVIYRVEGNVVPEESLAAECSRYVSKTGKNVLLLIHDRDVPHGAVVKVQDAAKGAGMTRVMVGLPPKK